MQLIPTFSVDYDFGPSPDVIWASWLSSLMVFIHTQINAKADQISAIIDRLVILVQQLKQFVSAWLCAQLSEPMTMELCQNGKFDSDNVIAVLATMHAITTKMRWIWIEKTAKAVLHHYSIENRKKKLAFKPFFPVIRIRKTYVYFFDNHLEF